MGHHRCCNTHKLTHTLWYGHMGSGQSKWHFIYSNYGFHLLNSITKFILKFLEFHFLVSSTRLQIIDMYFTLDNLWPKQNTFVHTVNIRNNNKICLQFTLSMFSTRIEMPETRSTANILRGWSDVHHKLEILYGKSVVNLCKNIHSWTQILNGKFCLCVCVCPSFVYCLLKQLCIIFANICTACGWCCMV